MQTPAILALLCVLAVSAHADLVNTNVEREIDLTNHLVTFTVKQTVANKGSSEVNEVTLAQDSALKGKLSFLSVKGEDNKPLPVKGNTVSVKIAPNKSVTLKVVAIFTAAQAPFPKAITQEETQLVQFVGNAYYTTPYLTEKQTTNIKVPGPVEAATKVQPFSKSDGKVVYGPYTNTAANTETEIVVHFENNTPFLTVTKLVREIEVSHWGNVAVTEDIDLLQSGAVLKGGFSRLDYQRIPNSGRSSVKSFTTQLPAAAEDVYYRDLIGNISTSNMRVGKNSVSLELRPRFPLFGGWKTFYTVGYNIPSYEVLSRDGSDFKLSVRFVDHIYDHMYVEKETLRVILPEGAEDIQVNSPFAVDAESRDVVVTYLDTYGRPVVVLTKSNLVEEHMQNVEISYKFSQISLLREPMLLIVFFFLLFSVAIIYNRIDFAIDTQSAVAKSKERYLLCEGELSKLRETLEKSADVVGKDGKLKAPASEFVENIKKIDAELAKKTEDIAIQVAKLSADTKNKEDSEDKINELLDRLQKAL